MSNDIKNKESFITGNMISVPFEDAPIGIALEDSGKNGMIRVQVMGPGVITVPAVIEDDYESKYNKLLDNIVEEKSNICPSFDSSDKCNMDRSNPELCRECWDGYINTLVAEDEELLDIVEDTEEPINKDSYNKVSKEIIDEFDKLKG